jgi:hypothetical protein
MVTRWRDKLFIYEINTWVWLTEISRQRGETITLANVPEDVIDSIALPGVDYIWMMGVWKRSPFGRQNALKWKHEYEGALPDVTDEDIIGSAYSIGDYQVDERIGGRAGLAAFREQLSRRGLNLMLDYVPNHVGIDHPWVHEHPDFIVMGTEEDAETRASDFFRHTDKDGNEVVLAHGRDPLFPGWADTAQLNAFNPELRKAVVATLLDIAEQCDGVRCDMAMLLFNEIFAGTWNGYVGDPPEQDYWREIIPQVRERHPNFMFVAEVYWDREPEVLDQGFDFAYDKVFYDRVLENDVQKLRAHLVASVEYQQRMMRFLENHDEPRAYDKLGHERSFPAATLLCTLPGGTLLHDGQLTGRIIKLPVQIARQPEEEEHPELRDYYLKLLDETRNPIYQHGNFYLFDVAPAGEGDPTNFNMLAYGWWNQTPENTEYRLVVVNMTEHTSYGRVNLGVWDWLPGKLWYLYDVTDGKEYQRQGEKMTSEGLFIKLEPYESHVFRFELAPEAEPVSEE